MHFNDPINEKFEKSFMTGLLVIVILHENAINYPLNPRFKQALCKEFKIIFPFFNLQFYPISKGSPQYSFRFIIAAAAKLTADHTQKAAAALALKNSKYLNKNKNAYKYLLAKFNTKLFEQSSILLLDRQNNINLINDAFERVLNKIDQTVSKKKN
jgi:hypothetical protein